MKLFIHFRNKKIAKILLRGIFLFANTLTAQNKISIPSGVTINAATTDSRTWARSNSGEKYYVRSTAWSDYGTCWYWGLKDTLKGIINANNNKPPNMSCAGLSDLVLDPTQSAKDSGKLIFNGITTYKYVSNSSGGNYITGQVNVRLTIKITDTLGNFLKFTDIDSAHVVRADRNFNIIALLESFGPTNAMSCSSGYCGKWCPSILLFDVLQTDPNSSICTSLNLNSFWSLAVVSNATNTGPYCERETVKLQATGGNSSYWKDANGFKSNSYDTSFIAATGVNAYLFTAVTKLGCEDTTLTWVTVNPVPVTNFSINDTTQCFKNNSFEIQNLTTVSIGNFSNTWWFGDSVNSQITNANPTKNYLQNGNFTIKLLAVTPNGCKDSLTKNVFIYPMPIIQPSIDSTCVDKQIMCKGNIQSFGDSIKYELWTFKNGVVDSLENSNHIFTEYGVDTLRFEAISIHGCSSIDTLSHAIYSVPMANMLISDSSICSGSSIKFSTKSTNSFGKITNIQWDFGDNTTSTDSSIIKPYSVKNTMSYNVTLYVTGQGKCKDSLVKRIDVEELPKTCNLSAKPDYSAFFWGVKLNPKDSANAIGGQATVQYTFMIEGIDTVIDNGVNAQAIIKLPKDGNYNIKMKAKNMFGDSCFCESNNTVFNMNRLDLSKMQANSGINLMPNPIESTENITIQHQGYETLNDIQLLSMGGILIERLHPNSKLIGGSLRTELMHKPLLSGIYIVRIVFTGETISLPIIVK